MPYFCSAALRSFFLSCRTGPDGSEPPDDCDGSLPQPATAAAAHSANSIHLQRRIKIPLPARWFFQLLGEGTRTRGDSGHGAGIVFVYKTIGDCVQPWCKPADKCSAKDLCLPV